MDANLDFLDQYQPTDQQCWQGRIDNPEIKERVHQVIQLLDLSSKEFLENISADNFCLLGFCCDEGVVRNLGRPGAAQGPDALRKSLASLPSQFQDTIYDAGNIICQNQNLEAAQKALGQAIELLTNLELSVIVLGGGHEVAWGHYQGLEKFTSNKKLGIINFDAHYDLRPLLENNLGSSGTPFLQVANARAESNNNFDYCCVGVQETANTPSLFKQAEKLKVKTILASKLHSDFQQVKTELIAYSQQFDALYITLCLDVFAHSAAPGVSAPQVDGLYPHQMLTLLSELVKNRKLNQVIYFDIAELAPKYDRDNQTARLAASCLHQFICSFH